jgi:hypothetical protein
MATSGPGDGAGSGAGRKRGFQGGESSAPASLGDESGGPHAARVCGALCLPALFQRCRRLGAAGGAEAADGPDCAA